jgi:vancomycin resistance protein YoaR
MSKRWRNAVVAGVAAAAVVALSAAVALAGPVIKGTKGDDTLTGTEGHDVILAFAGNDTVNALGGLDVVIAGRGNDTVNAGDGPDLVLGRPGDDVLNGDGGSDRIFAGLGVDTVNGGPGDDDLWALARGDVTGQPNEPADTVNGGPGNDVIHVRAHRFAVGFDPEALARVVRPRLGHWIERAHNAQLAVTGDRVHVVPSRAGRDVDPAQLAAAVTAAAHGDHVAQVELGGRQPELTTAKANALGIHRKLVSFTTEMGVSSSNRIHNVHLMADFIDGTVIGPGKIFSFNDVVGPRIAERGFLEGQEIIGSLVLPSIGGGVCQTATTLFNDAFELGLPILARTNHNLYLAHYPIGRDATVAWGGPDFEFRNDLKHGLLIKTTYTDSTLTFTFYGTSEGRRVVSSTGPQTKWTRPTMNYAVDPNAPRRSAKVVAGTGELGFDVTVDRTVYSKDGKKLRHDVFRSHYIPDSPTTVYGPGRTPAGPYIVLPTSI